MPAKLVTRDGFAPPAKAAIVRESSVFRDAGFLPSAVRLEELRQEERATRLR